MIQRGGCGWPKMRRVTMSLQLSRSSASGGGASPWYWAGWGLRRCRPWRQALPVSQGTTDEPDARQSSSRSASNRDSLDNFTACGRPSVNARAMVRGSPSDCLSPSTLVPGPTMASLAWPTPSRDGTRFLCFHNAIQRRARRILNTLPASPRPAMKQAIPPAALPLTGSASVATVELRMRGLPDEHRHRRTRPDRQ